MKIEVGSIVKIIDGPFASYEGPVLEVSPKVVIEITMFGKTGKCAFEAWEYDPSVTPPAWARAGLTPPGMRRT